MKTLTLALTIWTAFNSAALAQGLAGYRAGMERAAAASEAEDWPALSDALDEAQTAAPGSLYVYRNRILARMLLDRRDEALALASKAADRGLTLNLSGHPALEALTALPEFAPVAAKMAANSAPLGDASAVRSFSNKALLPEAIAYDRKETLYVGSVRTGAILKAKKHDEALTRIIGAPGGVFDIEIRGNKLWAAVNNQLAYENADPDDSFAAVMAFNAKTGELLREVRASETDALFGDLEIASDGTVYTSDSVTPRLFRMAPDGNALEVLSDDPRFANPQGIALDDKAGKLYMADYLAGLFVLDVETGDAAQLANEADAWLGGIDGLYLCKDGLIGVQNGSTPQRIVYMGLNDDRTAITTFLTLNRNLDGWNEPTHGAIVGAGFRYIATSNWPSYDNDWTVKEEPAPQPLRLMTLPLESN